MKDLFNKTEYFPTFIYNLSVSSLTFLPVEVRVQVPGAPKPLVSHFLSVSTLVS